MKENLLSMNAKKLGKVFVFCLCCAFMPVSIWAQVSLKIDSIKQQMQTQKEPIPLLRNHLKLSKLVYRKSFDESFQHAFAAKRLAKEAQEPIWQAKSEQMLGILHYFQQHYDSAGYYADQSAKNYLQNGDSIGYAGVQNLLANIASSTFLPEKAIKHLTSAQKTYEAVKDSSKLAAVLSNIGNIYYENNDYKQALNYYFKAFTIQESSGERTLAARALNNVAVIHLNRFQYNKALEYFLETKRRYLEVNDEEQLLHADLNIAKSYSGLNMYEKSLSLIIPKIENSEILYKRPKMHLEYFSVAAKSYLGEQSYEKAMSWAQKASAMALDESDTTLYLSNMGTEVKAALGSQAYNEAAELLKICDKYISHYDDTTDISLYYLVKAEYFIEKEKYDKAFTLLKPAKKYFEKKERLLDVSECLKLLVRAADGQGNLALSNIYLKESLAWSEQFFNSENAWSLAQFDVKREVAAKQVKDSLNNIYLRREKDAQIALERSRVQQQKTISYASIAGGILLFLLAASIYRSRQKTKKQNRAINQQKAAIEKRNAKIEWLLKEIHHRVKNNLQIVSSLMSIQGRALSDKASQAFIRESQNRIKSMSIVHESLYQVEDISEIEATDFIKRIAEGVSSSLSRQSGQVALHIHADDYTLNAEQAVPIGMIVNELSSNAFKHAFKDKDSGQLHIIFERQDENLVLYVSDDGYALPDDFQVDFRGKSIGMALVQSLAEDQLEGEFTWNEEGHKFKVSFPAAQAA